MLARQLLLQRHPLSLTAALDRMGGLQAQYVPSMYVGLWSRVSGFERDALTRALEARQVAQGTLLRATIHLVSASDYWTWAIACRDPRRAWWLRLHRGSVSDADMQAAADRVRAVLAGGPQPRKVVEAAAGSAAAAGVGLWVDLVRVPPSGTWDRRRADLYGDAESWLGPPTVDVATARSALARRYFGAFGPAAPADFGTWAGLPAAELAPVIETIAVRRFQAEDGTGLVDLPRAPRPDPATPAPVRFLPTWDAALLVHARRAGLVAEEHRPLVFNSTTPQSVATFLVDGTAAGTWKFADGRIVLGPFARLSRADAAAVKAEAARLVTMHRTGEPGPTG
jgi:hypothetical protein